MMREFIRRAVFSDGTKDYRIPPEPEAGDTVRIRLRTARGNAFAAVLVTNEQRIQMSVVSSDALFDYYEATLTIGEENISYYFLIWSGDKYYYYNQTGVTEAPDPTYDFKIMPGFKTPDWAKGAVMYQIFVDRFCNGNGINEVADHEYAYLGKHVQRVFRWDELPETDDIRRFYGGDLNGVLSKLDYLQNLGVEVIYFNPLFVSPSNHKYDIQDYDYIDPHFTVIPYDEGDVLNDGDLDNTHASRYINRVTDIRNLEASNSFFASLVAAIHARGMKVILDGVFNHCGSYNKWLDRQKIYTDERGYAPGAYISADSPYRDFFKFYSENWPDNEDYDGWWGHKTLPKLNYEGSKALEDYIIGIGRKWVSPPFCADGWRLDVAADLGFSEEYNHKFWKRFREEVKDANPDAIILAENYEASWKWLQGGEWDTIMNYEAFMEPVTWFLTGLEKHSDHYRADLLNNHEAFFGAMLYHMSRMNTQSLQVAMNELSNHDHSRFLTRTNGRCGRLASAGSAAASEGIKPAVMREAVLIQMTWPGAPTIYYGDEAGLAGWTDPDSRRTYPWGHEDRELLRFHKELIGIHRSYETLKTGSLKFLAGRHGIISYGRFDREHRFVIAINNNDTPETVEIPVWELGTLDTRAMVRLVETSDEGYNFEAVIYRSEHGVIVLRLKPHSGICIKNLPDYLL
ncbi:MAG: glycoside hydrolase family 13 protein [Lachnospiraceae bacterium]|nr:glycoside hydrolase family 13 protein [Lachnospiraceae bacterium]